MFSPAIEEVCEDEVSKVALRSSSAFNVVVNNKNVALSVSR